MMIESKQGETPFPHLNEAQQIIANTALMMMRSVGIGVVAMIFPEGATNACLVSSIGPAEAIPVLTNALRQAAADSEGAISVEVTESQETIQ